MRRMAELEKAGRVMPAGRKAFAARRDGKSAIYAYEQDRTTATLSPADLKAFKANARAWAFYRKTPPWYQRVTAWRILSAKRPETRAKRLADLLAACVEQRPLKGLRLAGSS